MGGSVVEFRCHAKVPQDPAALAHLQLDASRQIPLRNCGGRVTTKGYNTEATCPRCGQVYLLGDPRTTLIMVKKP